MNKIILEDNQKNIVLGNISVLNVDELREFRDGLIKVGYDDIIHKDRCTFKDLFSSDYVPNYSNNSLVKRVLKGIDENVVFYDSIETYNKFLNSILVFSSLLGDLDINNYDEIITKLFIWYGIMKYDSFDKVWSTCSKNFLKLGDNNPDFQAFQFAFANDLISFDVLSRLSVKECMDKRILKGMHMDELKQISYNSQLINRMNDVFQSKGIKRELKK